MNERDRTERLAALNARLRAASERGQSRISLTIDTAAALIAESEEADSARYLRHLAREHARQLQRIETARREYRESGDEKRRRQTTLLEKIGVEPLATGPTARERVELVRCYDYLKRPRPDATQRLIDGLEESTGGLFAAQSMSAQALDFLRSYTPPPVGGSYVFPVDVVAQPLGGNSELKALADVIEQQTADIEQVREEHPEALRSLRHWLYYKGLLVSDLTLEDLVEQARNAARMVLSHGPRPLSGPDAQSTIARFVGWTESTTAARLSETRGLMSPDHP